MHNIYVSGPMTGIPQKNFLAFYIAARDLRQAGYGVINPWELDTADKKDTWSECLRRDIRALMDCTAIATLPGWQKSKGAKFEIYIAQQLKWPVHTVEYWRNYALCNTRST